MPRSGQGFLLGLLDSVTHTWVSRISLISIPPLRPKGEKFEGELQRNRDVFVSSMLALALGSFLALYFCQGPQLHAILHWVAAFAIYRAFDLALTVIRIGVFFSFRGDVKIAEVQAWRVQRILVGVLMNYVELVFWYSLIYYDLSLQCTKQFHPDIRNLHQAFSLSFSTMTTVGYGLYAPDSMVSNLVAFAQSLTGLILIANAVGSLVAILTSKSAPGAPAAVDETPQLSWWRPVGSFVMIYAFIRWLLAQITCS